jgi:hypothetical protein
MSQFCKKNKNLRGISGTSIGDLCNDQFHRELLSKIKF